MELKVGLKFKRFYSKGNLSNLDYCEVRGIVDDYAIVLFCKCKANTMRGKKEFYKMIDIHEFNFNRDNKIFLPIK